MRTKVVALRDWLWPALDDKRRTQQSEEAKVRDQEVEIARRVEHLVRSKESLDSYLSASEGALERERSRRASVESRLIAIAGLMSIAATVVLGTLFSLATDKDMPPLGYARLIAPAVCVYLALQLTAAIHAAVQGLQAVGYQSELPQDLIPSPAQWGVDFRRERIRSVLDSLAQHRLVNNIKIGQLNVAYAAVRNFLWALLLAAVLAGLLAALRPRNAPLPVASPNGASERPTPSKHVTLTRIAVVGPFASGSHEVHVEQLGGCLRAAVAAANQRGDVRGWQVVGRTDRRNLRPEAALKYGSNEALAMARAKVVRDVMSAQLPEFDEANVLSAIGGPQVYSSTAADTVMGTDRVVEVYVLLEAHEYFATAVRRCSP